MKLLAVALVLIAASPSYELAEASPNVITLDCKSLAGSRSKFDGVVKVTNIATRDEPIRENETGSVQISLSRLQTEVLPDGSARRVEFVDHLHADNLVAKSEFIPAGELFVHAATIVTLSSSDLKASIRIILEKSGTNATTVFGSARYSAHCNID